MSHYSPIVAALITMLLTTLILLSKFGKEVQDIPNERSLHETPVPRIGGVALMAGILSGWALMLNSLMWWIVLPLLCLFIVSLLDDIYDMPVRIRLIAHLIASTVLIAGSGLLAQQGILISLIVLLLSVWMINLYNFMDGSDGLAGGMALFGFSFYGVAALMNQDAFFAMQNFSLGAAALGFLYSNFPPAKVFMGDAGSIPLGFLAAAMGLWGWLNGDWAAWFPLLVFSPFVADASVTLIKRFLRKAKVTEAHREHYYQRAIQLGAGHRNVALFEYALMFAAGVSALSVLHEGLPVILFLSWGVIFAALMRFIDVRWNSLKQARND